MTSNKNIKKPIEIERKWLLTDIDMFNANVRGYDYTIYEMEQGYFDHLRYRRQRLREEYVSGKKLAELKKYEYFQTIKSEPSIERTEYEMQLTKKQFDYMWPTTLGARLVKYRTKVRWNGVTLELDYIMHNYNNNPMTDIHGLRFLEIEFATREAADKYVAPKFFGQEVTGDHRYLNYTLARYGKIF